MIITAILGIIAIITAIGVDRSADHDVAWEMAVAREGEFFVGFYGGCCTEINMNITIQSSGYTRAGQWRSLQNGVPQRVQLTKEDWRFFKVETVSAAQISLKLMMIGELLSDADLYVSTVDWPSFVNFEYKSTNAGSDAIDISSATVVYVGVVGFGRSDCNSWRLVEPLHAVLICVLDMRCAGSYCGVV